MKAFFSSSMSQSSLYIKLFYMLAFFLDRHIVHMLSSLKLEPHTLRVSHCKNNGIYFKYKHTRLHQVLHGERKFQLCLFPFLIFISPLFHMLSMPFCLSVSILPCALGSVPHKSIQCTITPGATSLQLSTSLNAYPTKITILP